MDRELIAIVNEAIPLDPKCAINTKKAIVKRLWLWEKIRHYPAEQCSKKLSEQINAKDVNV
jgi:hypothetical protein